MDELSIYSNEPVFTGLYDAFLLNNGSKIRLININRNNAQNVIYLKMAMLGKMYIDVYRGYLDSNGKLQYELSNHQLVNNSTATVSEIKFQDFTEHNRNYINYYIELEALEFSVVLPSETGLYFDGIDAMNGFSNQVSCTISNDVNTSPLKQQLYTKLTNFKIVCLNAYKEQVIHVLEKPFYVVNKQGCLEHISGRLANKNIGIKYITSHTKFIEMTLTNIEEI